MKIVINYNGYSHSFYSKANFGSQKFDDVRFSAWTGFDAFERLKLKFSKMFYLAHILMTLLTFYEKCEKRAYPCSDV